MYIWLVICQQRLYTLWSHEEIYAKLASSLCSKPTLDTAKNKLAWQRNRSNNTGHLSPFLPPLADVRSKWSDQQTGLTGVCQNLNMCIFLQRQRRSIRPIKTEHVVYIHFLMVSVSTSVFMFKTPVWVALLPSSGLEAANVYCASLPACRNVCF